MFDVSEITQMQTKLNDDCSEWQNDRVKREWEWGGVREVTADCYVSSDFKARRSLIF